MLIARIEDLFGLCDKYQTPRFSKFLDEAQQELVLRDAVCPAGYNTGFFGGYENSQRKVFGVFPEWMEFDEKQFPIEVMVIRKKYEKALTPRDYLGTVLSLGIDRSNVGDILVEKNCAYVYMLSDVCSYACDNIDKISNVGVNVKVESFTDIMPPEQKFETINAVCASERLDAVVSAMLKISRNNAAGLIRAEKVSVNHMPITRVDRILNPKDIISVRGFGRYIFEEAGAKTRSDRIHIVVKKYI